MYIQVGGWSVQYEGLTYITVRGAGVPLVQVVPQGRTHAGRGKFYFRHRQLIIAQGNWSVKDVHIFFAGKNDILLPSEKKAPFY